MELGRWRRRMRRDVTRHSLESEIHRHGAEDEQQPKGSPSGLVDGGELRVLAGFQHEIVRLPEEGIVCANAVRSRWHFSANRVAVAQDGELFAVDRDEDFAEADVLRRLPA